MTTRRARARRLLIAAGLLLGLAACQSRDARRDQAPAAPAAPAREAPPASSAPERPRIVVLGDSLTAGLGLPQNESYPALLQQRVDAAGYRFEVVNAGVTGDTSAGGLSRLDWSMEGDVRILIVALGGNDGLRGLPVGEMKQNIGEIIRRAKAHGAAVLLTGMETLTNMGPVYQREFHNAFPELARQHRVAFLPFLLEGVAGQPDLNQPDGIHPTAQGARIVADHVWQVLEPMLTAAQR
jgi:acyl-CoA thioesterase I